MKNKLLIFIFFIFFSSYAFAENLFIESKNITVDKNRNLSIFENEVIIKTIKGDVIKSNYAEYDKSEGIIKLKGNIKAIDNQKNIIETEFAEYSEKNKIFKSIGTTKIITTEKYIISGQNIIMDNERNIIESDEKTLITDTDNNQISLENFRYNKVLNIFRSIGLTRLTDKKNNEYQFSQIYIDTGKKEILGTDTKAFINDDTLKSHVDNKPRIFSNTVKINNENSTFNKSRFTVCNYRKNNKCPPWTIQASKMLHDNKTKTIYYDNAIIKVYDIPIFYIPKLSHPDPTVNRASGFLPPSFSNSKNLGNGLSIPYFWALREDKNFTLTNKLFFNEHPLFQGEYHQAIKNGYLITDFGYTKGYKKQTVTKKSGEKSHFFSEFVKNFNNDDGSNQSLSLTVQNVSNDKYLKLYRPNSFLVDYTAGTLENTLKFSHENEDLFLGVSAEAYETLKTNYNDKYAYILPRVNLEKNLVYDERLGILDLRTSYKVLKYDTNKTENFLVNDFDWSSRDINRKNGLNNRILAHIRNINYDTKNVDLYKSDTTNELYGALGYLTEINLQKNSQGALHLLKPKMLIRYSPGEMRKQKSGDRLNPIKAFRIDRLNNSNNFETGLSGTVGFEYKIKNDGKDFDFSVAQIINQKENKKMAPKTSLDEKLSDLVGSAKYQINNKINLKYDFSLDQNYNNFNYNEIGTEIDLNPLKIDFSYLLEDKHIGNEEYFKTKVNLTKSSNGLFSFETKRNLISNSSEFYNLSYEYLNDCLRAGLVYRREFYNDSELEPENSLMFKITLSPLGQITSSFAQ